MSNKMSPIANKLLNEDGSITNFEGNILQEANTVGTEDYVSRTPIANKFISDDGSIHTLNEIVPKFIVASTEEYTIVSGDSLWALAQKFCTTMQTIMDLSGLKSDVLQVGQVIIVPTDYCSGNIQIQAGKFIPSITSEDSTASITSLIQKGYFSIINKLCNIQIRISANIVAGTSEDSDLMFSLPFKITNDSNFPQTLFIKYTGSNLSSVNLTGYMQGHPGDTFLKAYTNGGDVIKVVSNTTASQADFYISGNYVTT
jgi:LysM repeat protein